MPRKRGEQAQKKGVIRSMWRRISRDQMGSAVILMLALLAIFLCYIGVYAKVCKNGYYRAGALAELREARVQNVRLRADIQALSSPELLAQIAKASGMQTAINIDYLEERRPVVLADAGSR